MNLANFNLPHTWEGDIREPLFTFSVGGDTRYGFYLNNIVQNAEVALVLGSSVVLATVLSWILFTFVIVPKKQNTSFAYLLGFGVIIPFWILSPMPLIRFFNLRNKVFRFVFGTIPTLTIFRTLEGAYSRTS